MRATTAPLVPNRVDVLPAEQVAGAVFVALEHCRRCQAPLRATTVRLPSWPWRSKVMEVLLLAVHVTEQQAGQRAVGAHERSGAMT